MNRIGSPLQDESHKKKKETKKKRRRRKRRRTNKKRVNEYFISVSSGARR